MSQKYFAIFNKSLTAITVLGIGYALYKFTDTGERLVKNLTETTGFVIKPMTDYYYSVLYGLGIDDITPDFDVNKLNQDYFYSDWTMTPEAREVFFNTYENEMNIIIGADGRLKNEYRTEINLGDFATK